MILKNTLFLAAYTERSKAYAQAMQNIGLYPEHIILFGTRGVSRLGQSKKNFAVTHAYRQAGKLDGFFIPDFSKPLDETVAQYKSETKNLAVDTINDPLIVSEITKLQPKLIIYSGYGGQIVSSEVLKTSPAFLHMHAGWLPDYQGSTTLYYSILKERACGVSAILLNEKIDRGVIVKRSRYPLPPAGTDIDYFYDGVVRADILIQVLKEWQKQGDFSEKIAQDHLSGTVYYVIHPVLKHLALLSL